MDPAKFEEFQRCESLGLKSAEKIAIKEFCDSFASFEERVEWVRANLAAQPTNRHARIRHELYEQVIFPVLEKGFHENDAYCLFWLGMTHQNLYGARHLHNAVGGLHEVGYYQRAYEQDNKSDEIRLGLLNALLKQFDYVAHEWPEGFLIGPPDDDTCDHFLDEVAFARALDKEQRVSDWLNDLERYTEEYRSRGCR